MAKIKTRTQKERHKAVPVVYLLMRKEGRVLLMLRHNTGYMDGKYMVPSGHVEKQESLTRAIAREAMEEVGITFDKNDLRLCHVMYRAAQDATGERADFFFTIDRWEGDPKNCEPDKCKTLEWFSLEQLPEEIAPYLGEAISSIREGEILSELYW